MADEAAPASWMFPASWSELWTSGLDPLPAGSHPHEGTVVVTGAQPHEVVPDWSWSDDWFVAFVFVDCAVELASFDWVTAPSLPGLSTRTPMLLFVAPDW